MEPKQIRKEFDKVLKEISKREKEKSKICNQLDKIGIELITLYSKKKQLQYKLNH